MATEELLKLIQEDPMGYEGYLAYAKYLETINLKQAYLTYENALYFCDDETMKKTIQSKLDEIAYRNGKVEPASIVIVCYNNRPLTQQCIESIRETTPEFAREIVIVDNNSQDDSVDYLRQQKDIVLIENDYNAGFPGGCNIGIEAAKPENDIFLLNNDTIMCFNTLYTLRMGLYEKDNYGSAGCVTNNCANNQSVFKSESLDELKEFGRNNNIPNKRSEIKLMLIGFALIVKRKVLEKVGYLDERFNPGNFEDDDLSLRILMNNYQNVLVYNSFLIHLESVSFNNADYFNLLHKNFDKLIDKYNFINEKHFFCFTHSECNLPFYKDKIDNLYNNANVLVSQCDVVVPRSCIAEYVKQAKKIASKYGLRVEPCGHCGDGNIHTELLRGPEQSDLEWKHATHAALTELYVLAKELGGQMSGEHGTGNGRLSFLKDFVGDRMIDLYKQIKIAFDPNLILNPGKMIEFNEEDTNEK